MFAQLSLNRNLAWMMLLCGYFIVGPARGTDTESAPTSGTRTQQNKKQSDLPQRESAVFAGGCFWCVESDFENAPGVVEVISGYSGGRTKNPTYANYAAGGHREVVFVVYDPAQVSYAGLVEYLIKHVDPINKIGQFQDKGRQYSPAIYYDTEEEKLAAEKVIAAINEMKVFRGKLNVALEKRQAFWPAEGYHQNYYLTHPVKAQYFRLASGRDAFVMQHWGARANEVELDGGIPSPPSSSGRVDDDSQPSGHYAAAATAPQPAWTQFKKPSDAELRSELTKLQYTVTQHSDTEPAFGNAYWNNHKPGIYVDILSGEPLFSSSDKFESGTGWPSFVAPIDPQAVRYQEDHEMEYARIEVRSRYGDSHLGHVFDDGPPARGGKRYCMNSAAMRFVPKEEMAEQGYSNYLPLVH